MWYNLYVYFETCWFGDCKENYKTKFIKIYFHFDKLFRMKFTSVITISYQFLTLKTWKIFSLNHTHIKPSTSVLKSLFPDRFQCVRNAQPIRHASFNIVHLLLLCVLFHRELYVNMFFLYPHTYTQVFISCIVWGASIDGRSLLSGLHRLTVTMMAIVGPTAICGSLWTSIRFISTELVKLCEVFLCEELIGFW